MRPVSTPVQTNVPAAQESPTTHCNQMMFLQLVRDTAHSPPLPCPPLLHKNGTQKKTILAEYSGKDIINAHTCGT